jgi:hypothetical protein
VKLFVSGKMVAFGQIFSRETQAIFYNWKPNPVQRMLDFDFLCGMLWARSIIHWALLPETPSTCFATVLDEAMSRLHQKYLLYG